MTSDLIDLTQLQSLQVDETGSSVPSENSQAKLFLKGESG